MTISVKLTCDICKKTMEFVPHSMRPAAILGEIIVEEENADKGFPGTARIPLPGDWNTLGKVGEETYLTCPECDEKEREEEERKNHNDIISRKLPENPGAVEEQPPDLEVNEADDENIPGDEWKKP